LSPSVTNDPSIALAGLEPDGIGALSRRRVVSSHVETDAGFSVTEGIYI
jgi:hypothetical protein